MIRLISTALQTSAKLIPLKLCKIYVVSFLFLGGESINLIRFSNLPFSYEDEIYHVIHFK